MRILHTADWHIGQTLNGWTRESEHAAFLGLLPDLVEDQGVDALVMAGDVFDGFNPSAESMQLLYDALLALHRRRPHLTTVIVAGNHDPALRLEAPAALLRRIGVHVVGVMHRRDGEIDLARHLVPLRDAAGDIAAHVLAIPFLRAADLPGLGQNREREGGEQSTDEAGSPIARATRRLYREAVEASRATGAGMPLLATGHLHCAGGLESEGAERRILVGGEHAVPPELFPEDLSYVALGHLHRPQSIGQERIRYSGAPFPLSATEIGYEHGVSILDVDRHGTVATHVRLDRPVACLRLSVAPADLEAALTRLALDPGCPRQRQPFLHLVLTPDGPAPGLAAEAERILSSLPVRCGSVRIERPRPALAEGARAPAVVPLAEWDPSDLFTRAFAAAHGVEPGTEHRAAFHRALAGD
jgi:DNA repair protein SbcD/Mre11